MIHRTPSILPLLYPSLLWRMPVDKKELYLTFDDGPFPGPTEFVLEQLNKHKIKGTFFCIGDNIRKHSNVFQKIVSEGHTIGNHTFNHLKGWQTRLNTYVENIQQCDEAIAAHCLLPTAYFFRPPYGRITRNQIRSIPEKKIVMWDVLTCDYDQSLLPEKCLRASLQVIRNGSIIVFHDSLKAEKNMSYALPRLIEDCLNRGYTFKPLI
jgi:peptidoglycan-N-acetylglucosamine deacetylase